MQTEAGSQAVMFADVSGSTRLYEVLGDARALECVAACIAIMREATAREGGRVVKSTGDGVMGVFPDASSAARAAAVMQARVTEHAPVAGERLAIRIGAHFGPVIEEAGDVFGDSVNVAARMAALAKSGQILGTQQFAEALAPELRPMTRSLDRFAVKGKDEEVAAWEVLWERSEDMTTVVSRPVESRMRMTLRHGLREMVAGPEVKSLSFGRDPDNDFQIDDKKASRQHAKIERRRDKFMLVDMSSNGTYLTLQGQPEMGLRREEMVLYGRGSISFGHRYADDPTEVVTFEIGS
jgi:adenylate cyclase